MTPPCVRLSERWPPQGVMTASYLATKVRSGARGCRPCHGWGNVHQFNCRKCAGTGNYGRRLVELMAYCGHKFAQEVSTCCGSDGCSWGWHRDVCHASAWVWGLTQDHGAIQRAAIACARIHAARVISRPGSSTAPLDVIAAAQLLVDKPSDESHERMLSLVPLSDPWQRLVEVVDAFVRQHDRADHLADDLIDRLSWGHGYGDRRRAIERDLIGWATKELMSS